jgi:NADH-quinone oxidoreductase subunit L
VPISESVSGLAAAAMVGLGIYLAYFLYLRRRELVDRLAGTALGSALYRLWFADWGFDWLYDRVFVRPVVALARMNRSDFVDAMYDGMAALVRISNRGAAMTQNGRLRWYAAGVAAGSTILLAIVLFL